MRLGRSGLPESSLLGAACISLLGAKSMLPEEDDDDDDGFVEISGSGTSFESSPNFGTLMALSASPVKWTSIDMAGDSGVVKHLASSSLTVLRNHVRLAMSRVAKTMRKLRYW